VFIATFDLERIRRWRKVERSNIWRRPELYGALANRETVDPLARSRAETIAEEVRRRNIK
jgi:hypothetical protein